MSSSLKIVALAATLVVALAGCDTSTAPAPLVAAKLAFVELGPTIVAGKPIAPGVSVEVQDAEGRPITALSIPVTIALSSNPVGATLSGTTTVNSSNGVATFTNLQIDRTAPGFAFTATATGLASADSPPFSVQADVPSTLTFSTQPGTATAGIAISPAIQITVADAHGNLATNSAVPVQLEVRDATTGLLVYQASTLPSDGIATFAGVAIERASSYTAYASGTNIAPVASGNFTIAPAAAARLAFVAQPNAQADAGRPVGAVQVAVQDAFGNLVTSASAPVTMNLATNPRVAALSGTLTADPVDGIATFSNVRVDKPANGYTLGASSSGVSSGTSNPFNVRFLYAEVSAGGAEAGSHTCALTNTGAAYCWGSNQFGQLGDGSTTARWRPALVSGELTFASISAGARHTCGVTTGSELFCWGDNAAAQLGDGTADQRTTPVKVSGSTTYSTVSAGYTHTCALSTAGAAFCWGDNPEGRIGDGSTSPRTIPTAVSGGLVFQRLSSDSAHNCALAGTTAYCWGAGTLGQMGDGSQSSRTVPTLVSGGHAFGVIATGARHSCAVTTSGQNYYCWGNNSHQQTALSGQSIPRVNPEQGWPTFLLQMSAFAAGSDFNCVISVFLNVADPLAGCWGNNSSGQLGNGGFTDLAGPGSLAFPAPHSPLRVDTGKAHGCIVAPPALLYCWGNNASGQLGDGTTNLRSAPVLITP